MAETDRPTAGSSGESTLTVFVAFGAYLVAYVVLATAFALESVFAGPGGATVTR